MDSKLSMNFTNLKFCDVKTSDIDETCSYIAQQEYSRFSMSPCGCRTSCSESLYEVCNCKITLCTFFSKFAIHTFQSRLHQLSQLGPQLNHGL